MGLIEDEPPTARQKLGHHLESAILGMLAEEADIYVEPRPVGQKVDIPIDMLEFADDVCVYTGDYQDMPSLEEILKKEEP